MLQSVAMDLRWTCNTTYLLINDSVFAFANRLTLILMNLSNYFVGKNQLILAHSLPRECFLIFAYFRFYQGDPVLNPLTPWDRPPLKNIFCIYGIDSKTEVSIVFSTPRQNPFFFPFG